MKGIREPALTLFFASSAALPLVVLVAIVVIFADAAPLLLGQGESRPPLGAPLARTFAIAGIALSIAAPLGVIAAAYLAEVASDLERWLLRPLMAALAGIPGVAFGWLALTVVRPELARASPHLPLDGPLLPALVMAAMLIPVVSGLAEEALAAVPRSLRESGWALGGSPFSVLLLVVLPAAKKGLAAAVLIALARAVGETIIVWMASGERAALGPAAARLRLDGELELALAVGALLLMFTMSLNALAYRWVRGPRSWT